MADYTQLNKAMLATLSSPAAVLAGLATLDFRQSDIAAVQGLVDGYNNVAPDYSSYTELDYEYGVAIKLVEANGRSTDDTLTRYANAVASVRGDTTKQLGEHFDEQQLSWANAIAVFF